MQLYNAGLFAANFQKTGRVYSKLDPTERYMRDCNAYFLESYHYIDKASAVKKIRAEGVKVFLDSGAFSAFTKGVKIDIGAYCDYIHKNDDVILFPSVLDEIGDADGTWRNQDEMERRGTKPLPCYHFGEPPEILDYYIASYDYITIGG